MSIDRSLRLKDALVRHRNVLTRAERIDKLKEEEKWGDEQSVLGLPKVGHRKVRAKKVAKEKEETVEGAVAGAEGAPAAPGAAAPAAKGAPAGKAGAAPAAKAAAPAAKPAAKDAKKK
jgi:small basic protein (TIGR04137 family)